MPGAVQKEIDDTFGLKRGKNRQDYLKRVVAKIIDITEDEWEGLSAATQKWYNTALKARDSNKTLPEMPGEAAAEVEEEEEEAPAKSKSKTKAKAEEEADEEEEAEPEADDEEEEEVQPKKKVAAKGKTASAKSKGNGKVEAKSKSKSTTPAVRPIPTGAPTVIRQLMLKNINITKDELVQKLKDKGMKTSPFTVGTVRNDFRLTLRILQEEGLLKRDVL